MLEVGTLEGAAVARLEIRLLGRLVVTHDGSEVTQLGSDTTKALLALLASDPGRVWSRPTIAELLWPERRQGVALGNLRHALSVLRRAIAGSTVLVTDRATVSFAAGDDTWVDLVEFGDLARVSPDAPDAFGAWQRATELWRGDFLEGLQPHTGAEWEEWKLTLAEQSRRTLADALRQMADWYENVGDLDGVIDTARRLIDTDPLDERGHRRLMQALADQGEHALAATHFAALTKRFEEEYQAQPSPQTVALADRIRRGETSGWQPAATGIPAEWLRAVPSEVPGSICVGRGSELDVLRSHLDAVDRGRGRFVLISGEAGSGKTTLVAEFGRRATDACTVSGRCNSVGGLGDPYLPFREVLSLLAGDVETGLKGGALTAEQANRLWDGMPRIAQLIDEHGPHLPGVMIDGAGMVQRAGLAAPDAPWLQGMRSRIETMTNPAGTSRIQPAIFDEYTAVLSRAAEESPVVVVIDDLQWADAGSTALLWHLVRRLDRLQVLIIGAFRPEELTNTAESTAFASIMSELAVQADATMDLGADREFVDAIVDAEPNRLDDEFRRKLHALTGGNALFTVEMLKGMQERAEVTQDRNGAWVQHESLDWDRMPRRVEAAIERRIARFPADLVADLTAASVQGEDFIAEVTSAVCDDSGTSTRLHHHARSIGRVTEPVGIDRIDHRLATRHRFRHLLFQQYLYRTLSDAEHIHLHEATARALEALYAGHPNPPVADLAYHFDRARLVEPGVDYLERAARRARGMAANDEAIRLLQRARQLLDELPASPERDHREVELLVLLAASVNNARGWGTPEAQHISDRIRQLIDSMKPSVATVLALIRLAGSYIVAARPDAAMPLTKGALEMAEAIGNPTLRSAAEFERGVCLCQTGEFEASHEALQRAYEADHDLDPTIVDAYGADPVPQALTYDAGNAEALGFLDRARAMRERAMVLARSRNHPYTRCFTLVNAGTMLVKYGDHDAALEAVVELEEVLAEHHYPFWAAKALSLRGSLAARRGDDESAIDLIERALAQLRATGVTAWNWMDVAELAEFEHRRGERTRAFQVLCDGESETDPAGAPAGALALSIQRGRLLRLEGDEAALDVLLGALAGTESFGDHHLALIAARELALLYEAGGHNAAATDVLAPRFERFEEGFSTPLLMSAREVLARL